MHKASRGPEKGAVSAQKALWGSDTETRELLGGTEENSPDEGSLICPPGKSMSFHKKETEKNWVSGQNCWAPGSPWASPSSRGLQPRRRPRHPPGRLPDQVFRVQAPPSLGYHTYARPWVSLVSYQVSFSQIFKMILHVVVLKKIVRSYFYIFFLQIESDRGIISCSAILKLIWDIAELRKPNIILGLLLGFSRMCVVLQFYLLQNGS